MKTPSGTYFEVSELKRRVFVVVGPNFVSPSLNGGGGLKFSAHTNSTRAHKVINSDYAIGDFWGSS